MESLFKSVGLVARYDKKAALKLADEIADYLAKQGLKVYVEDTLIGKISTKQEMVSLAKMKADLIVTIGGDGTILRTCLTVPKPEPPILGVNMGIRSFLTEVEPEGVFEALDKILKGEYKIQKRTKLAVSIDNEPLPDALNDVVLSGGEVARIVYTEVWKDGKPILKCQADGLIVATQTGSTGYSLSAGGPVLDPGASAFVITAICPLTVFQPVVFPAKSSITLRVTNQTDVLVLIDGKNRKLVSSKQPTLTVSLSKNSTPFIKFGNDFYDRVRNRCFIREQNEPSDK